MAALEAIYGVLGVLGGATIGAWSAGRLQRGAHKTTAATAAAEKNARTLELALETTSTARIATRAWALFMELAVQDLATSRPVDLATFDSEVKTLLGDVTSALFRLAAIPDIPFAEAPARMNSPLTRSTRTVREALLQKESSRTVGPGQAATLLALVRDGAADMNETFVRQTNLLTGRTPAPLEPSQPASLPDHLTEQQPYMGLPDHLSRSAPQLSLPDYVGMSAPAPSPLPFEPFWFAVPMLRRLYTLDGEPSPPPRDQLRPGAWHLAIDQHRLGLVVAVADDLKLVLRDTEGIQRG
ncbi:hypothetical protein [Streptomyces sp. NPDC015125]|uniref:hypothetical protein n=1 Tax=Streptomyces sp. NPDC015125 TaxID=3364938 RepID=UPI0036FFFA49